jgi:hypothetical protein
VTAITVECKYDSGLSNRGSGGDDQQAPEGDGQDEADWGHQLADEYLGLFQRIWKELPQPAVSTLQRASRWVLLYVTCHDELPATDLEEAAKHVRAAHGRDHVPVEPERAMFWLGWSSIYEALGGASRDVVSPAAQHLVDDVRAVLKLRGMTPFNPFQTLTAVETCESLLEERIWSQDLPRVPKYQSLLG